MLADVLKFFIGFALVAWLVEYATQHVPRSWDPTGIGMLAMILLFIGFIFGAFKVGASFSDRHSEHFRGPIWKVYTRPVRSLKYGLISFLINIGLLYLTMVITDLIFH